MELMDPFALPPASQKTTRALTAAVGYIQEQMTRQADARNIIKGLVQRHGAKLTYPSYRTALRCGGIYTEVAHACDLATAKMLISILTNKAERYLAAQLETTARALSNLNGGVVIEVGGPEAADLPRAH